MPAKSAYNIDSLNQFCLQNDIKLLHIYDKVCRDTKIEGYCKTPNCNGSYKKAFRMLNEYKNFYCHTCLKTIKNEKTKQTCLEKYGQVTNLLVEETKNKCHSAETIIKRKQTNLIKYGAEYPFQNELIKQKIKVTYSNKYKDKPKKQKLTKEEIKNKVKETSLKKYGHTSPTKNEEVKQKIQNTNLQRYGYKSALQNKDVIAKRKQTNLLKYGVEYPSQNQEIKNKVRQTCLDRFGVEYPLQSEEVKSRSKHTSLQKYGYEHYQHNKIASENASKKAYKLKTFITPSGKEIMCQGYEPFALDYLLNCLNIEEKDVITSRKNVPDIWYTDKNNKKHRHYVDIFIPTENLCIEVKSDWTIKKKQDNVYLKQQAAKDLGYKYEIWIYNELGNCIEIYN